MKLSIILAAGVLLLPACETKNYYTIAPDKTVCGPALSAQSSNEPSGFPLEGNTVLENSKPDAFVLKPDVTTLQNRQITAVPYPTAEATPVPDDECPNVLDIGQTIFLKIGQSEVNCTYFSQNGRRMILDMEGSG